eukprot:scaffold263738_cov17-Tisochrysis_lutea.AAC.1
MLAGVLICVTCAHGLAEQDIAPGVWDTQWLVHQMLEPCSVHKVRSALQAVSLAIQGWICSQGWPAGKASHPQANKKAWPRCALELALPSTSFSVSNFSSDFEGIRFPPCNDPFHNVR